MPQDRDHDTAHPETAHPGTALPETVDPHKADPDTADPDTADPDIADPDIADPDTAHPDGADSHSTAWAWDPSLYAGSARFYPVGRVAYPAQLADELVRTLTLDGSGVLVDVGCGPGSLTLLLARHVEQAIGVDADADMLAEASRLASEQGIRNATWRHLRAEQLPADLPRARLVTFAQSFHWMDRQRVAALVMGMLEPGGAVVHVGARTHEGIDTDRQLRYPRPPREAIAALIGRYLGARRRAGKGVVPEEVPDQPRVATVSAPVFGEGGEDDIFRAAGFRGPERLEVPGRVVVRTAEQVVASVYSLSSAAPHLFGDRLDAFDGELRQLIAGSAPEGLFSEQMGAIGVSVWR